MDKDNIIAIDLAKSVFQVCSPRGQIIYNREVSRKRLKELLVKERSLWLCNDPLSRQEMLETLDVKISPKTLQRRLVILIESQVIAV
jgi:hypothetical protein